MSNKVFDVIVVGGGASGLMAGITAAKSGCNVCILEHIDVAGKKILATGNGRCNFTNRKQGASYYRSDTPAFVLPSLENFTAQDTISFFQSLGVMTTEKNGYCYPRTMQAATIRNALLKEVQRLHIKLLCDIGIRKIEKKNGIFIFDTKTGVFSSKACILATGGKAEPKSGSDGSGYLYAKQLGHRITEPVPALVPLVSNAAWLKAVKGVRQEAKVSLFVDDAFVFADHGEVQFTDYGLSGIPVFQLSRFAAKALVEKQNVTVSIDFVPDTTADALKQWISNQIEQYKTTGSMTDILSGIVNQKIAQQIALQLPFANQSFAKLSKKQLSMLVEKATYGLKQTVVTITETKSFVQAQVTAGGCILLEKSWMWTACAADIISSGRGHQGI